MKIIGVVHEHYGSKPPRFPQRFSGVPLRRKTEADLTFEAVSRLLSKAKAEGAKRVGVELPPVAISGSFKRKLFFRLNVVAAELGMEVFHIDNLAAYRANVRTANAMVASIKQLKEDLKNMKAGLPIKHGVSPRFTPAFISAKNDYMSYLRSKLFAREAKRKRLDVVIVGKHHAYHLSEMFPSAKLLLLSDTGKLHPPIEKEVQRAREDEQVYLANRTYRKYLGF